MVIAAEFDRGQNPETGQQRDLKSVAAQFEAVLLETLVGGLQKSFSTLGSEKDFGVSSTYDYLGTQALASAWAEAGGMGLAKMISSKFMNNR